MSEVNALPSAARAKLEALQNAAQPPASEQPPVQETPPAPQPPVQEMPPTSQQPPVQESQVERVTLTREELNDLRAAADAARAMEARLEESELRNSALTRRLTELEDSHKGSPKPPLAPGPAAPASTAVPKIEAQVQFTEEEEERFGDSKDYIAKVVEARVAAMLNPILDKLGSKLAEVEQSSTSVAQRWETTEQANFSRQLVEAAPNYRQLIAHKNWRQFMHETDELTGYTMESILASHIEKRDAAKAAKIYKRFEDKYVAPLPKATETSAYAGAAPGTGVSELPAAPVAKEKLKLSDRKKASQDYIHGKITYDQLKEVTRKFEEAEKAGNVDHNS